MKTTKSKTRLYRIWAAMKQRCLNPRCTSYSRYGGRGIRICQEWIESYAKFEAWALASGYSDSLSIDRVDNSWHYLPENCRWATAKQQARNTSANVKVMVGDQSVMALEVAERAGLNPGTVHARVRRNWPSELLCVKPAKGRIASRSDRPDLGPNARGERNGRAKLTASKVKAIRLSADSHGCLAAQYGIDKKTVRDIRSGTIWAHVTPRFWIKFHPGGGASSERQAESTT